MQFCNLATVSVLTTAGGTEILSSTAAQEATTSGLVAALIYPSVEIRLVDAGGSSPVFAGKITGAIAGTGTNSAAVCPAGQNTTVLHRGGPLRAISPSGTATVAITLATAP